MSFGDQPTYGSWKNVGCCMLVLVLAGSNLLFLISWYFSFYDLSTETYRPLVINDLLVPSVVMGSAALLWSYVHFVMRDKD